jgi:hypothetical protein
LEHAREHGVPGKVAREERFLAGDAIPGSHALSGFVFVDGVDEAKWRTVRQQRDEIRVLTSHAGDDNASVGSAFVSLPFGR